MIYQIFRNNILVVGVKPDDNSELSQKKQTEDIIRLNFSLTENVDIRVGDYISFAKTKELYVINDTPRVQERPNDYYYECIFEGSIHNFRKTKVLLNTPKSGGGVYIDYKFSLTGNAQTFLEFIVSNLNRNGGSYIVGKAKDTAYVTIEFNNWNAFDAINEISTALSFAWYLDGMTLNFDEKNVDSTYTFQVGRLTGFTKLTRMRVESEHIITVVYGYGSTLNLPPRTSGFDSELLSENRLSFVGVDGLSKLEKNTNLYGNIEAIQEFDIKPERDGVVTAIDSNVQIIYDNTIDFDIELQKLSGSKPKIKFLSGALMGMTFDIAFDLDSKKITMDFYTDSSGVYPNSIIKAAVNDTYDLIDVIMPSIYITDAQTRLRDVTQAYLNEHSINMEVFQGEIDPDVIEASGMVLNIGDLIRVVSTTFMIDNLYEINELVQGITKPNQYTIKVGDVLPKGLLSRLKNMNFSTQQEIYNIQKNVITTNNIINNTQVVEWQSL
jgi:hypothetical protein